VVGKDVEIDQNVKIGPFCTIVGKVKIASGSRFYASVMIGFPAQCLGVKESLGAIEIGHNCEFREFSTVHASRQADGSTKIGNNCYIMCFAHVGHDATLEDNVTLINSVNLAGHAYIERNAILMGGAAMHQFCRVGQYTAVAPFGGSRQDLPPFCLFNKQPGEFAGLNIIGLKRSGFTAQNINSLKHLTNLFYQKKLPLDQIKTLALQEPVWGDDATVKTFLTFVENSKRGISRRSISDIAASE
jgi:UDP-N-acetylglucosamine acyltransferase